MVVKSNASTSIKDGGVGVAVEVCGHNLSKEEVYMSICKKKKTDAENKHKSAVVIIFLMKVPNKWKKGQNCKDIFTLMRLWHHLVAYMCLTHSWFVNTCQRLWIIQNDLYFLYLVLCVSQDSLHGSLRCCLDNLLDVVILGLKDNTL